MLNTMSKIRGQEKGPGYPQAEALLAEAMLKFGKELGDECNFGKSGFFSCKLLKYDGPVFHSMDIERLRAQRSYRMLNFLKHLNPDDHQQSVKLVLCVSSAQAETAVTNT